MRVRSATPHAAWRVLVGTESDGEEDGLPTGDSVGVWSVDLAPEVADRGPPHISPPLSLVHRLRC